MFLLVGLADFTNPPLPLRVVPTLHKSNSKKKSRNSWEVVGVSAAEQIVLHSPAQPALLPDP